MNTTIVYLDDADYATQHIAALRRKDHAGQTADPRGDGGSEPSLRNQPTHWVLVGCAPRMTHRISKWVSHSARENWRGKWFAKTQEQVMPLLQHPGDTVTPVLAQGSLTDLTQRLKQEHGAARVVDARRPKLGVDMEPVSPDQKPAGHTGWALPGATMGLGALLVLANELAE